MGRKPRVEEEGLVHHVIQRGNNQEFIFAEDTDKEYLTGLFRLLPAAGYNIYGYVIMGNHYHLLLGSSVEPLPSAMHKTNLRYSKYFNRKYGHTGHVFQGRYKAFPVRDDSYLLAVLRYIHQNPVRAGVCQGVCEYKWSSDSYYREHKNHNNWVRVDLALDILGNSREKAVKGYADFMAVAEKDNCNYESSVDTGGVPEDNFCLEKEENFPRLSLDEVLLATGVNEQEFLLIKSGSRHRNLTAYKLAYAVEALKLNYTLRAIGKNIKVSDAAILYLMKERRK
ncbi:MAG: Transposase IS200 like protein [Firmicutes bacterium ADurb.Bin456]|nr:MAG: Transposase IS200 like protein [Firmicutes bacterium ADurb.Bin456]